LKLLQSLRSLLPGKEELKQQPGMNLFGDLHQDRNLWALNRGSVSAAVGIGVFCAFLPMPFETVVAMFLAIMWRANLPVSMTVVWISNPITWVPLYTPCYLLGARILRLDPIPLQDISLLSLGWHYVALWLGCLIAGSTLGIGSRFIIAWLWRFQVRSEWRERRRHRMARKAQRAHNKGTGHISTDPENDPDEKPGR
jgi:uncharacterized protein (DUF2062 family)